MGDHRALIKIEMEFHGVRDKCDLWINWSPTTSECDGVDQRVIDFVRSVHERGMAKWDRALEEDLEAKRAKEEADEREEYERLRLKYGDN